MFPTLPHFCRICLKYDKNLIDLAHIENEPSETLMSKLQFCASEVEWNTYKPLLCHPCIKRLNIAYGFKKECIQSANVLKSYLELLKESQLKSQAQLASGEAGQQSGTYMLLPNQKYLKILVGTGAQHQNSFQNVFLNVIPTTPNPPVLVPTDSPKNKDTNQNIFLNINNIFKKYVPIAPNESAKPNLDKNNVNVSQLLTETKTEELSVEIDPTDYGLVDEGDTSGDEAENDWDEVITHSKINSDVTISKLSSGSKVKHSNEKNSNDEGKNSVSFVPILPKHGATENVSDEKMEYFNAGHFLSSAQGNNERREYICESCQKAFPNLVDLKTHLKHYHMGKLPYKCDYCYIEFAVRSDYETCMKFHKEQAEASNSSLTLQDFANGANIPEPIQPVVQPTVHSDENDDFICDVCHRVFTSSTGLLRHKVRKHNQKNKKKYFIKGMKNARCDICKREFSTQSYMQLHRKLHLRDVTGYKYKVFGKNKYVGDGEGGNKKSKPGKDDSKESDSDNLNSINAETVDCTPDILLDKDDDESEYEEEKEHSSVEMEIPVVKTYSSKVNKQPVVKQEIQNEVDMETEVSEEAQDVVGDGENHLNCEDMKQEMIEVEEMKYETHDTN